MKIRKSTEKYESWLSERTNLIRSDLELKHRLMAKDPFLFLRGTFYRWMQVWNDVVPDLSSAPEVLAVGDLHVENFGTWRDAEGRLIWGINDFDDSYPLPYTNDLVRLAVSAKLAGQTNALAIKFEAACEAILRGYVKSLATGASLALAVWVENVLWQLQIGMEEKWPTRQSQSLRRHVYGLMTPRVTIIFFTKIYSKILDGHLIHP